MKKLLSLLLALALVFSLAACGSKNDGANTDGDAQNGENTESVDLIVFAAASMTETLNEIAEIKERRFVRDTSSLLHIMGDNDYSIVFL